MLNKVFALVALLSLSACAVDTVTPSDTYLKSIDEYSQGEVQYDGAYNTFNYRGTLMNSVIQERIIEKKAEVYLWDAVKKQQELSTLQSENGTKTKVFLSFFTPVRTDDNLSTKKSVWAIYLETSQGRYEGVVKKNRTSMTELSVLFPHHNRFTTAYDVEFPVAVNAIESEATTMTVTGPLGTKKITFPAKK